MYQPLRTQLPSKVDFLMTRGGNTAWILADGALRLASTNQLAPSAFQDYDDDEVPDCATATDVPGVPDDPAAAQPVAVPPRRGSRIRRPPDRFVAP